MSPTRRIFIFIALPLVITFAGLAIYLGSNRNATTQDQNNKSATTENAANTEDCQLASPVDVSHVSSVLYPGQIRGGDYKAHGGFRMDNTTNNNVEVKAPLAAKVTGGSRYIEMDEVQYMFDFETDCGLKYRFDHLKTLSAKLQAAAENLPEPKVDDSRTSRVSGVRVDQGEVIATAVGFEKSPSGAPTGPNVSFDFGLYSTKQKNEASKDAAYAQAHKENSMALYAICWFDMLPAADAAKIKSLPAGDATSGNKSDYCK